MATRIYARGFPGNAALAVDVERKATRSAFPTNTIFGSNAKIVRVTVNPQIMHSYEQLIRGDLKAVSFDFKERVILETKKAFGVATVGDWIKEAITLESVSQSHIDFIGDFLNFALHGADRKLPAQTWETLIIPQHRSALELEIPDAVKGFLGSSVYLGGLVSEGFDYSIDELIARWLSRPTGFSDMLVTLNTLFGDLPFHS